MLFFCLCYLFSFLISWLGEIKQLPHLTFEKVRVFFWFFSHTPYLKRKVCETCWSKFHKLLSSVCSHHLRLLLLWLHFYFCSSEQSAKERWHMVQGSRSSQLPSALLRCGWKNLHSLPRRAIVWNGPNVHDAIETVVGQLDRYIFRLCTECSDSSMQTAHHCW